MVPSADIGERHLYPQICLDHLCKLPEAVSETAPRVVSTSRRLVLGRVSGLEHLHSFKRFLAGAVQNGVYRLRIHGFKGVGDRRRLCVATAHTEVADVAYRDRRFTSR